MAPTDREMLQEILRRLGRIEQRLGLTEFKSDIGGPGAREYPTQSSQRPVEPVVSSSPDQPRRIPSDGPLPELLDPDKGKSGGLPKERPSPSDDVVLVAPPDPESGIEVDESEAPIRSAEGEANRLEEPDKPED